MARACAGEPDLHTRLERLLAADAGGKGYLDEAAARVLPVASGHGTSEHLPPDAVPGFELVEPIGSGGMGVVYKARDHTLHRWVALKFLHPGPRADGEALLREARAASALDHPNVATVHQVGVSRASDGEGRPYLVMPWYDGPTLAEEILRGRLPLERVVGWGIQVADGLARAHEEGIVHRDVKPSNLVLTRQGRVKILDFGIAGAVDAFPDGGDTAGGTRARGTLAYMSPEQLLGGPVDARTDLWSLGVVLYELLTGRPPFEGASSGGTRAEILEGPTPPVDALRPDAPAELGRLVSRCLERPPGRRPADAGTVGAELRRIRSRIDAAKGRDPSRLLVLPLVNISPDPANEYLSDGLTEELITRLTGLGSLRVIASSSARRLKGSTRTAAELGRELGVAYVLEGGVRKASGRLRITVGLVEAASDTRIWSRAFDGTVEEALEIQEDVARGVADALSVRLSPTDDESVTRRPLQDPRAYEFYLRARGEVWRFAPESLARARRSLEMALELVGENALLLSTLGHVLALSVESGMETAPDAVDQVEALADRTARLDPRSARAHWLRAFVAFHRGDPALAARAGEEALELGPGDPDTLLLLGYVYAHLGRNREARRLLERAVRLDPLTPLTRCMPGFVSLMEGRFDEAVEPYRRMYEMDPDSPFAVVTYGWVLAYAGRTAEALGVLDKAAERFGGTPFGAWATSLGHGLRGDRAAALDAITPAFEAAAGASEMFARALTHCLATAGAPEHALRWLRRAVELGLWNEAFVAQHDAFLEPLRGHPGFPAVVQEIRTRKARSVRR
jgi:serine/threonine protein kinase/cytochrome c-type biogenesis protein CcmH/NrfG